jgi:hypothetical protein
MTTKKPSIRPTRKAVECATAFCHIRMDITEII